VFIFVLFVCKVDRDVCEIKKNGKDKLLATLF